MKFKPFSIKHSVLNIIITKREKEKLSKDDYVDIFSNIDYLGNNLEIYYDAIVYLVCDGYIEYNPANNIEFRVTGKGESAYRIKYFIEKRFLHIQNVTLFIVQIIVAITSVYAILISSFEINSIKKDLDEVRLFYKINTQKNTEILKQTVQKGTCDTIPK